MRKRILTVAALAAALATSLVIGSTTVSADLSKVDVSKTNDADFDGIFTDDEVVDPALVLGQIEFRITIVNGSDGNVEIVKLTDTILTITGTSCEALDGKGVILKPATAVGCTLFGVAPTVVQENTVLVDVADDETTETKTDSTKVRPAILPATLQLFNVRINVAGTLVEGEVENLSFTVDETGPIVIASTTVRTKVVQTVELPTVRVAAGVNVQLTATAEPGSTFTSWSMEGTTVEGATGTQLDLDIREFTVKLKVKKEKEKEKEPAEEREAEVEFRVLFAPDAEGRFSADFDLGGSIHVVPQP